MNISIRKRNDGQSDSAADDLPLALTVAICTRNRVVLLERAMASVLTQLTEGVELLVVDNASTDGTPGLVARYVANDQRVRIYREDVLGLSVARNTAVLKARGEYVLFLDDDAVAEPGWLAAYQTFLSQASHGRIGGAGGPVIPAYEAPPPRWMQASAGFFVESKRPCLCQSGEDPWGCNFAVRRQTALAAGGFNNLLGHRGSSPGAHEEVELLDRLRRAGYEIWWVPNARIKHFMAADRMRLNWQLRAAFGSGRCRAVRRLSRLSNARSCLLFAGKRLLIAPFHCAANLLLVLISFPFYRGLIAARALGHAMDTAGFAWGLLWEVFASKDHA